MSHNALHLRVGLIPRHQQHRTLFFGLRGNALDLLHKGAGSVMVRDSSSFQFIVYAAGYPVAADDHLAPGGHILHGVYHLCTLAPHILHRLRVVDQRAQRRYLMPLGQQAVGQFHGTVHTKAEPCRFRQTDLHFYAPIFSHASSSACLLARSFLVSRRPSMANCAAGIGSP